MLPYCTSPELAEPGLRELTYLGATETDTTELDDELGFASAFYCLDLKLFAAVLRLRRAATLCAAAAAILPATKFGPI